MDKKASSKDPKASPTEDRRKLPVTWSQPTRFTVPIPEREAERLVALRHYQLLDTPPEPEFDDLTLLASALCQTPIALISLVDSNRQWFKSKVGLSASETSRDVAFCAHAIMQRDILVVPDATQDERFASNPLVTSDPKIRFYAGMPLVTADDLALGTICVIDFVPRTLSPEQQAALHALGRQVMALLELRGHTLRHREREAELQERASLQNAILNSANYSIISTDPNGIIRIFNRTAERLLGYRAEEVVGQTTPLLMHDAGEVARRARTLTEVLGHQVEPGFETFVARARLGEPDESEWTYVRKDGSRFPVLLSVTTLRNDQGEITGYLGIASDISDRKYVETELAKACDAAVASARLKAEFLANMSHEIRTPMNGVLGMTGLLLSTELTAQQRGYAEAIRTSADSLLLIINDILDLSKIEAGKMTFEHYDFNLRDTVEGGLELLAEKAQAKGLELVGSMAADVPLRLRGDPVRLGQILNNLLSNAVKFTECGEVTLRVSQEHETETHVLLRFAVRDTGIGLSAEAQTRLFQPFSQAVGSTTRKYGGTGLGLAIAKQLASMMRGQIGAQSVPGQGSTFWFTAELEKRNQAATKISPGRIADLTDVKILIVDDNVASREVLLDRVISWQMVGQSAASAAEALQLLREAAAQGESYQLGVLDMQMPDADGLELAREIKREPAVSGIRLLLLTPLSERFDPDQLREAGFEDCLPKPVKHLRMFNALSSIVEKSRRQAEPIPETRTSREPVLTPPSDSPIARVLLVEDNLINQRVALGQLERLGYKTEWAANGLMALQALEEKPFDIILMDCQMPEMDGYETTCQIRLREQDPASLLHRRLQPIRIIAMTANAMKGDREKCLAAGMDDYISKPVQITELQAALNRNAPAVSELLGAVVPSVPEGRAGTAQGGEIGAAPIDLERLREVADGDPAIIRDLVALYFERAEELLHKLETAIQSGSASELRQIAHQFCGSSSTCGMNAVVQPLRELEQLGQAGTLVGTAQRCEEVKASLGTLRQFATQAKLWG